MSSVCRTALPLVVALALLAGSRCIAAPDAPPTQEQINRWIEQLGDKEFDRRQEASRRLWDAGEPAEKPLQKAVTSDDAEVRRRAKDILDKFKWGVYPDTPKNVVELVHRYQGAENNAQKLELMRDLFNQGVSGCRTLVKIGTADDDENMRGQVYRILGGNVPRFMPVALIDNKFDLVEKLLDLGVRTEDFGKSNLSNYCAYWLFQGKLDERIKELDEKKDRTKLQSELLAYLYRTKGDLRTAKAIAEKADLAELTERLLYEMGDWKELARRDSAEQQHNGPEKLSYRAAYQRLAGDALGFEQTLTQFRKTVQEAAPPEKQIQSYYLAKALFLNDRPAEALQELDHAGHYAMLFEILVVQYRYADALALVDRAKKEEHKDLPLLEILQARTLYNLGDKDKAQEIFTRRGGEIKAGNSFAWFEDLVAAEFQVGLKEQAFEHAAKVLELSPDGKLFDRLFPGRADAAEVWWKYFRQQAPTATTATTLKQLRDLFDGQRSVKEVEALIEGARAAMKDVRTEEADKAWLALADTARAAKLDELQRICLERGGSAATLQRLGDVLAEKKEWTAAATAYRKAWDKAPAQPLPLLLTGKALAQAGKEKEGKRLVEQGHWLLLGDDRARNEFAMALGQRGFADDARRENELIMKLGEAGSYYAGDAERRLAVEALLHKDYLKAANGQERTLLRCLRTYVKFLQSPAYLGVPTLTHRLRARGLLDAGKFEEAQKEIAYCRAALPGDVDLAVLVVPELEKLGHKKEADELFAQTVAVYDKINADYPKCAWSHNSIAWLSVCCKRDLEKAQTHAQKAVDLAPTSAGHHDTLAEIYFQLGQKEKALAEQRRAIDLEPKRAYFRKQLQRIEAGDPKAERPSDLDDDDD